ncbi:MAG: 50S ribosomal protein L22 [Patescibacteria group bacterium]
MQIIAEQKTTRQAPRKVRLVANAVKKMSVEAALRQLAVMERRSSVVVMKVMRQAIANAQHNHNLNFDELTINNILVTEGPRYKRFNAVSRGRAHSIIKRTCHVKVALETKEIGKPVAKSESKEEVKDTKKAEAVKAPVKKEVKKAAAKVVAKSKK